MFPLHCSLFQRHKKRRTEKHGLQKGFFFWKKFYSKGCKFIYSQTALRPNEREPGENTTLCFFYRKFDAELLSLFDWLYLA